jgi:hypothetical protein
MSLPEVPSFCFTGSVTRPKIDWSLLSRLVIQSTQTQEIENLMVRRTWWPSAGPSQLVLVQNFDAKIDSYGTALGLSTSQLANAHIVCAGFIEAYNLTQQCKASMKAMTQWRTLVFTGTPTGRAVPAPPTFPSTGLPAYTRGVVTQFYALRDQIVSATGYTDAIGQDLGIVGTEIPPVPPSAVTPDLKATVSAGNWVNLVGSMQGMDALRVEYSPKGGEFTTVAFLTKTPGGFQVNTALPDQPENGFLRCIYIKKNEDFGNYSPTYQVTLS